MEPPQNSERMEVCLLTMPTPLWIVIIAVAAIVCFLLGINYRTKVAEPAIASAEKEKKQKNKKKKKKCHSLPSLPQTYTANFT